MRKMPARLSMVALILGTGLVTACSSDGTRGDLQNKDSALSFATTQVTGLREGLPNSVTTNSAINGVDDVQTLKEIEAIEQLKARYCRLLDTKQWEAWREVFTDDFVSDTSEAAGKVIEGADEFVAFVRQQLGKPSQTTSHQVHMPEIELTSATTAKGIWALEDWVDFTPVLGLHGHGHYHETYVKINGRWRIKYSKLTRIRQELITPAVSLPLPDLKKALEGRDEGLMDPLGRSAPPY
ncbi:nuclear transport factor 2 family protein [Pendulispora brunnea]|uniref:Nuclear transport factor 2 family protein n=1 Tax=Pendulispora brunnea TaxID=2905690 RepID=A0ABZ2KH62_9BACT